MSRERLIEIKETMATALAAALDIPLVAEQHEPAFFSGLIEIVWARTPNIVRNAISQATDYIDPASIESVTTTLLRLIKPIISERLFWLKADQADQVSAAVVQQLVAASSKPA